MDSFDITSSYRQTSIFEFDAASFHVYGVLWGCIMGVEASSRSFSPFSFLSGMTSDLNSTNADGLKDMDG